MQPTPDFGALSQLTDEQRNAVVAFREQHGRNWKEKLGSLWLSPRSQGHLHVVRNTLGPEWLQSVREADFKAVAKAAEIEVKVRIDDNVLRVNNSSEDAMNPARQFIEAIASNFSEQVKSLSSIRYVLEDGEALLLLGVGDEDQEMVEEAHSMVCEWIKGGLETLNQVVQGEMVAGEKSLSRYLVIHPQMGVCLDGSTGSDLSRHMWSKDKMLPEEYANFAVTFTSAEIAGLKEYFGHAAWADELQTVEVVPDMDLNCVSMQECVRLGLDAWEVCKLYSIKANKADEGFLNSLGVKLGDFDDETGGYLVRLGNAAFQQLAEFKADFPVRVVSPFPESELSAVSKNSVTTNKPVGSSEPEPL